MIGILAYGSLIEDPGEELSPLIIDRLNTITPFSVEFKRKSAGRCNAPTLIPVLNSGSQVSATILVLDNGVTLTEAKSMLWRRETRIDDVTRQYSEPTKATVNQVIVEQLNNFDGIETVLYTSIGQNIPEPVTAETLATYAIESILAEAGSVHRDGVRYLMQAHRNGIRTDLSEAYEREILRRAQCKTLEDAIILLDDIRRGTRRHENFR